ncbi:hypothetical protein [Sulfuriroseicoccus oceanibius]|uniref:Uncharacterized protein n=1 Tax=Sulfuriroseicoccus oceanibius TaxID=2707525 RepID=A0A6B3L9F9_9BACT|nr:hypothetical protein [Sulfuriroseicoccus oceanibius]QQL44600.1 hypothetical protein G3M56_012015 [Sulfuriroseicoccus oceanibius]
MEILFDLRSQPESPLVDLANNRLRKERPDYLERFGAIGSAEWWAHFDAGSICRTIHSGIITHLGIAEDTNHPEGEDIIRISTDRRDIEYDREGFWLRDEIAIGDQVEITKVQVVTPNCTTILDVKVTRKPKG